VGRVDYEEARDIAADVMRRCRMCPVSCGAHRLEGKAGACRVADKIVVASAFLHYGEERVLVGRFGSGTIFLSGCNLHCVFCQNWDISQRVRGEEMSEEDLVGLMFALEARGAHNINFVSPTHFALPILCAIIRARQKGLRVPVVWNSGGYDSLEVLRALDGWVEIYMPDAKYADNSSAHRFSGVKDYWDVLRANLVEMHRQVGDLEIEGGIAVRGLLVRHLVLPQGLSGAQKVIEFLARRISPNTFVNIMGQYRPCYQARRYRELTRGIDWAEFEAVREQARKLGLRLAK